MCRPGSLSSGQFAAPIDEKTLLLWISNTGRLNGMDGAAFNLFLQRRVSGFFTFW